MTRRVLAILLILLAAAVAGLLVWTRSGATATGRRRPRVFLDATPAPAGVSAPGTSTSSLTPVDTVRLTLFFPGRGDGRLKPEPRDIPRPSGAGPFVRAIFGELQKGPTSPDLIGVLPQKIQFRNGFLLPEGEVVLDLAVDSSVSFGSAEELSIVASLVDTVLQNVAETRRVRILVNGEPAESLGGHVDLTRPLLSFRGDVAS